MKIAGLITLKKGKESSILRFHPWVFSGAIAKISPGLVDGCWVEVKSSTHETLGFGHYQSQGSISVRLLDFNSAPPNEDFWVNRLRNAYQHRLALGFPNNATNCFRLIHGEGDQLPGLIIDLYNGMAVIQAHDLGMHEDRLDIAAALREVMGPEIHGIYYKSSGTLPGKVRAQVQDEYLFGMSVVPHIVAENKLHFSVDWERGQKTGFFLDQRDNRQLLATFSAGRKVLNTFCYSGGFSVYALSAGATQVVSVDSSAKAIELTQQNLQLNGFSPEQHPCITMDTFEFLQSNNDEFDVIILDPPAFAKHRDAKSQATKGYQRLNAEALKVIRSGGFLFTFSCSQVIDSQLFYHTVVAAAIQSGRKVRLLHRIGQPADHPVSLFHPEGEYLKGLVLQID